MEPNATPEVVTNPEAPVADGFGDIPNEDKDGNVTIPQADAPPKAEVPAGPPPVPADEPPTDEPPVVEKPSGMQINAGNVVPKGPTVTDYGDNEPVAQPSDCQYLEELGQVDTMISKIILDGRKDTVRNEHRVEALRCLKMAMPSLARI